MWLVKLFLSTVKSNYLELQLIINQDSKKHINEHCRKASSSSTEDKEILAEKVRLLANAFIDSQYNYASLMWMCAYLIINDICM